MFNGRSYEFGFDSEPGILGPDWFWPLVFTNLQAITRKDGTELLAIGFNPNTKGPYTAGFGNRNFAAGGYQIVDQAARTIKSYVLGSNSFFPLGYENWTTIGGGMEEVFEPVIGLADIARDNTSYTALVDRAEGKFTENGALILKDALVRAT